MAKDYNKLKMENDRIKKNLYEKSLHIYTQTSDDDAAGKQAMVLIANALMNLDEVITKT